MKAKPCIAEGCNNPRWSKGFCSYHQHLRTDEKYKQSQQRSKQNVNKTSSKIVKNWMGKRKPTGEKVLFDAIWNTRPHVSFISGVKLGKEARVGFFAHVLPKSIYNKFRLCDKNIVLLTEAEHALYDQGSEEKREEYAYLMKERRNVLVDWEKLYSLAEELKQEYKNKEQ